MISFIGDKHLAGQDHVTDDLHAFSYVCYRIESFHIPSDHQTKKNKQMFSRLQTKSFDTDHGTNVAWKSVQISSSCMFNLHRLLVWIPSNSNLFPAEF